MRHLPSAAAAAALALGLAAPAAALAQGLNFSGYARFGLQFTEGATGGWGAGEVAPTSRLRLNLRATTETDFGATLAVTARAQASNGQTLAFNAPRFTVSGGGLSVQIGNISGAFADTPGLDDIIGLTGLSAPDKAARTRGREAWDDYESRGAGAAANNGVQIGYAVGGFRAALSYSDRNPTAGAPAMVVPLPPALGGPVTVDPGTPATPRRERIGGHAAYSLDNFTFAMGFQDSDVPAEDYVLLTAGAEFDAFGVTLQAADNRGVKKATLQGRFRATPQLLLNAFIGHESGNPAASQQWNGTSGGVGIDFALGGGADFQAGVVRRSDSTVLADAGVIFRF